MIPQSTIETILERTDIVGLVESYGLELKRAGRDWVCCCPFHNERTPSFHVSEVRQSWHCFGACQEGGNAISFVMKQEGLSFPEACRRLAQRAGVMLEEEMEEPEAQQERRKREALWALNWRVADFYVSLLEGEPGARSLAVARWGAEAVRDALVGVAPNAWDTLVSWARQRGENFGFLQELGLIRVSEKTGNYYDAFRNRLVLPIRDRLGNVTGFTCRTLGDDKDTAKYVNSPESLVYRKREELYGLDVAWKTAWKEQVVYAVEGAADALKMQSVGIFNAVAPLGGVWTREQLRLLQKVTKNICFIPDQDVPKRGEDWGAGITYVMKNGLEAIRQGMTVSVRELPFGADGTKQDPGDFFTSRQRMAELEERDFVLWMAEKRFDAADNLQKQKEAVQEVAEVVSFIKDDLTVKMLLPELNKIHKASVKIWQMAVEGKRNLRNLQRKQEDGTRDLAQYDIYTNREGYYSRTEKGDYQWSNFTMQPLFHVMDDDSPRRIYKVKNMFGQEQVVEMTIEEMVSLQKFRQKLESCGNFVWKAKDPELIRLKSYLYDNTRSARRVRQMGWSDNGFYAFGNGLWTDGEFYEADKEGFVDLGQAAGTWYIPAASKKLQNGSAYERERRFVHTQTQTMPMKEYLQKFVEVYGDNGKVGLAYWLTSCFRDVVKRLTDKFPILDLFGQKGSGKTYFGQALTTFFIMENKMLDLNISTVAALSEEIGYSCNALVHLDEYKNSLHPNKIALLKNLYDGTGRSKMSGANFTEKTETPVRSGVIISGQEMPTADIALFQRCIFLSFQKGVFSPEEMRRFAELQEIQKMGLTGMTLEVLKHRRIVETSYKEAYDKTLRDINARTSGTRVETRIKETWGRLLAMVRVLDGRLQLPFTYEEMENICLAGLINQNTLSGTGNEMAQFWRTVEFLREDNQIFYGGDYYLRLKKEFRGEDIYKVYAKPHRLLYISTNRIFTLYRKAALSVGNTPLPEDSLIEYLKNEPYFLSRSYVTRMKVFNKAGYPEQIVENGHSRDKYRRTRCWIFDYDELEKLYHINLEGDDSPEAIPEEDDSQAQDQKLPL